MTEHSKPLCAYCGLPATFKVTQFHVMASTSDRVVCTGHVGIAVYAQPNRQATVRCVA
jgi:hypothetical protein